MERPASQYVITCDQIDQKIVTDSEFSTILFLCLHILLVDVYTCEISDSADYSKAEDLVPLRN